jgi:hypothetical protein
MDESFVFPRFHYTPCPQSAGICLTLILINKLATPDTFCDLMQFFASEHAVLRRLALGTVNQFIVLLPAVSTFSPHKETNVNCKHGSCGYCSTLS